MRVNVFQRHFARCSAIDEERPVVGLRLAQAKTTIVVSAQCVLAAAVPDGLPTESAATRPASPPSQPPRAPPTPYSSVPEHSSCGQIIAPFVLPSFMVGSQFRCGNRSPLHFGPDRKNNPEQQPDRCGAQLSPTSVRTIPAFAYAAEPNRSCFQDLRTKRKIV